MTASRVQHNYWAILVAAVASFLLAACWYTYFMEAWLQGISRTMESFKSSAVPTYIPPAVAFVLAGIVAIAISCITQLTGPQTAARGIKTGFLLWLGFVCTVLGTEYIYELRPAMFAINAGYWLISMTVMGAILGAWKKKLPANTAVSADRAKAVVG